ncbi:hypothetical protein R3P38DRAFT_2941311 [Favolaschia claudopus]|uniref:Chromo shadow domain-containing protein n=1 Tax=Favolaschia claudopus TaxID=2862362 RepID=A0AAW0BM19_9AGAR
MSSANSTPRSSPESALSSSSVWDDAWLAHPSDDDSPSDDGRRDSAPYSGVPLALSEIDTPKTFNQLLETGSQSAPALTVTEAKDVLRSLAKQPQSKELAQSRYEASDLTADPELAEEYDELDWENLVQDITTIEYLSGKIMVSFNVRSGHHKSWPSDICRPRFPQKLLQYYESRLRGDLEISLGSPKFLSRSPHRLRMTETNRVHMHFNSCSSS